MGMKEYLWLLILKEGAGGAAILRIYGTNEM